MAEISTRMLLLQAAERLFARGGITGTSTRRIAQAAGQRNISALQYHFGTKEQLIEDLRVLRLQRIDQRREQLLTRPGASLHEILRAWIFPLLEELASPDSHILGCLHQFHNANSNHPYATTSAPSSDGSLHASRALDYALRHIPGRIRCQRILFMDAHVGHVMAAWYYQRERGETLPSLAMLGDSLIDYLAGGLMAPISNRANTPSMELQEEACTES